MAVRPVFCATNSAPFCRVSDVEFEYASGFAVSQKQKCISNLHKSFLALRPQRSILEISSKSLLPLGVSLSAFNLPVAAEGLDCSVECAFQGSKVFAKGGPYTDLYEKSSREAKKDVRLKESGNLTKFCFLGEDFPLMPKDLFYNWLYIKSLHANPELSAQILEFDSFTDIEFNPKKSLNCQAKAAAIYIGLHKNGLLEEALKSPEDFKRIVYPPMKLHL